MKMKLGRLLELLGYWAAKPFRTLEEFGFNMKIRNCTCDFCKKGKVIE